MQTWITFRHMAHGFEEGMVLKIDILNRFEILTVGFSIHFFSPLDGQEKVLENKLKN